MVPPLEINELSIDSYVNDTYFSNKRGQTQNNVNNSSDKKKNILSRVF